MVLLRSVATMSDFLYSLTNEEATDIKDGIVASFNTRQVGATTIHIVPLGTLNNSTEPAHDLPEPIPPTKARILAGELKKAA